MFLEVPPGTGGKGEAGEPVDVAPVIGVVDFRSQAADPGLDGGFGVFGLVGGG